jgi:hypothetical protein
MIDQIIQATVALRFPTAARPPRERGGFSPPQQLNTVSTSFSHSLMPPTAANLARKIYVPFVSFSLAHTVPMFL